MKKLILILIVVFLCSFSKADTTSYEVVGGSITEHLVLGPNDPQAAFQTKIGDGGKLIYNPLYGIRTVTENDSRYYSFAGFAGDNSIGEPMYGGMASAGIKVLDQHLYLGGVFGTYGQSDSSYLQSGDIPFKWGMIGDTDIVPIVGIEANVKINLSDSTYLKLNNLVTPILTNTSLSFGIHF